MSASYYINTNTVVYNAYFQLLMTSFDATYDYLMSKIEGNEEKEYWLSLGFLKIHSFFLFSQNNFKLFEKHLNEEVKWLESHKNLTDEQNLYKEIVDAAVDIKKSILLRFIEGYSKY